MSKIRRQHLIASLTACVAILVYGAGHGAGQDAHNNMRPNRIRILTLGKASPNKTIGVPGCSYVGSPSFSKDGEWIAFDAYKQSADPSTASGRQAENAA